VYTHKGRFNNFEMNSSNCIQHWGDTGSKAAGNISHVVSLVNKSHEQCYQKCRK